ncbi:Major facilitator superfamily domain general substrate transporter [Penicillium robsamsonii]|uniref:Major facilitator superfamily domain general substrate transporter n=1 Tax=Penicillium robsamsonii TaxID=1792511 RepID=UPI0025470217|nr:Major facilitator superfamily domain general substrate transporter [Penicillium robsamsonii]KAJ5823636.1 Major facilitator superfamily domain general substrate transporter [Penicillium robsamsonii]
MEASQAIAIAGFGYSNLNTLLVGLPTSVFTLIWVVLATILVNRTASPLAGSIMVSQIDPTKKVSRLAGMWLFRAYSTGILIILSIIASNVAGYTKRTTMTAVMFIGNCAGNITGSFLFFDDEMPDYGIGIMISLAIAFVAILGLRQIFQFQNQQHDRRQNVKIDPELRRDFETDEVAALDRALDEG